MHMKFWLGDFLGNYHVVKLMCRVENNIKMALREIYYEVVMRFEQAYCRIQWWAFVNVMMNLWIL